MAERKLIEPGRWYDEFAPDGSFVSNCYYDSYYRILGYEPGELVIKEFSDWTDRIHPDDVARVMAYSEDICAKHPEGMDYDIEYRMMTRWGYRLFHDFGHCTRLDDGTLIRCDGVIFDIQDIADRENSRTETIAQMAGGVSSYILYPGTSRFKILTQSSHLAEKYPEDEDYRSSILRYINTEVFGPDRKKLSEATDIPNLLQSLESQDEFRILYRDISRSYPRWYELRAVRLSGDEILIGFTDRDEELIEKLLYDKMKESYFGLYYVNLDNAHVQIIKTGHPELTGEAGAAVPYKELLIKMAAASEGEAAQFLRRISDINEIMTHFAVENQSYHIYKTKLFDAERWIAYTGLVLSRHEDGSPAVFALGFSLLDEEACVKEEANSRLAGQQKIMEEELQIIRGLAGEYETLYYLNMDENVFKPYTLEKERAPEIEKMLAKCTGAFDLVRMYGQTELIHPDDRALFTELSDEKVREKLAHRKKYTVRYRRLLKGEYVWSEMDVIKFEAVDERANSMAVGFANRDAEIRTEQALNSCFTILGEDISPERSISRLLAETGDFYGAERCYVFEFTGGGELMSNTYEWCAEGAEPMIEKLQDIPASEVSGWMEEFERHGAFSMDALDTEGAYGSDEGRALLEMQGIESLIAAPIAVEGETVGFIGVDNPRKAKGNLAVLKNVAVVTYSEILQRRENSEERITLGKLTDAFVSVYYVDLNSDYMRTWKIDEEYRDAYGKTEHYSVSMGGYVRKNIAERDRERCILMTSPAFVLGQFSRKNRFSIEMTDIMLGFERSFVFDYIRVSDDGKQFVVCCRDVTDSLRREKEQQKKLENARRAAEQANRSKTSFLFNMSHDIRTPMNAITGFTGMAKKHLDDREKVADYLDKIDTSGQQLLGLINQVLEMARIESGKIELDEESVNVREEYDSLVTVLSEQAAEKGLEFHHALNDIKHNFVLADTARLSSITLNVTGNAMKYTPRGGRIDFSLSELPPRKAGFATYTLTVQDTGIGMSENYLKVLFEPFTREKNSTVSKIQGTGLGMAIVRELVDIFGGDIKVKSAPGKGTRFDITIDLRIDGHEGSAIQREEPVDYSRFKGRRVLLVEDNELNREIATDILREQGIEIESAEDGTVAVEVMREKGAQYYDFILMDIQMPIMNGYEATRNIRRMYPYRHIPIIALSANAFAEDRAASLAAGMDDHVAKPINVRELFSTMAKFL